jgi:hypothetical protein
MRFGRTTCPDARHEKDTKHRKDTKFRSVAVNVGMRRDSLLPVQRREFSSDVDTIASAPVRFPPPPRVLMGNREHRWRCAWSLVTLEDGARPLDGVVDPGCPMAAGSSRVPDSQDGCRPARRFDGERFRRRANTGQAGSLPRVCARTHTAHSSLEDDPVHVPSHTRPCAEFGHPSSLFASVSSRQPPQVSDFSCFERSHAHAFLVRTSQNVFSSRDEQRSI